MTISKKNRDPRARRQKTQGRNDTIQNVAVFQNFQGRKRRRKKKKEVQISFTMGSQLSDCMQESSNHDELEQLKSSHSLNLERIAFLEDQNEELSLRFTSLQNDHFHDMIDKVNLERKIEAMQTQMDQQKASDETKQQQETTHLEEDLVALKLQKDASETKANTLLQLNKTLFLQKEESDQKAATLLQLNKTLLEKIKENQMQIAAVNQRIAAMEHNVTDENNKKRTNNKQQKPNPRVAQML